MDPKTYELARRVRSQLEQILDAVDDAEERLRDEVSTIIEEELANTTILDDLTLEIALHDLGSSRARIQGVLRQIDARLAAFDEERAEAPS